MAVIIPCYRVAKHVLQVIQHVGPEVELIFVVDDKCPEQSGRLVEEHARDPRVRVLYHEQNGGVGAAMITGFRAAMTAGAEILVKVDGDGQMDTRLIPRLIRPIETGQADYAKGNRFHTLYNARQMPGIRSLGNVALSFLTKTSSGYWSIFDPTNGFVAVHAAVLHWLNLDAVSKRFFFESDLLIKLGDIRAVVIDVPMEAVYQDEVSNLNPGKVLLPFLSRHLYAYFRRIIYFYFLRDFNLASLSLLFGIPLLLFGVGFGGVMWWRLSAAGEVATTGTVMLAALPIVLGFQLVMFFLGYDVANQPRVPLHSLLTPVSAGSRNEH